MVKSQVRSLMEWLRRVITQPRHELSRWQRTVRFGYDLGRYGARQLREDKAPQMAGALAFRTLFSLLPVFVVGTIVIKAIGGFDQFIARISELFEALGMNQVTVQEAVVQGADQATGKSQSLSDWLISIISQVEHINLAAITWVGVAVLFYSAVSLMVTIENSFNSVYRAPGGRAWMRRFPIYFTILVLGPTAIAMSVVLNNSFNKAIADQEGWWNLVRAAPFIWTFFVTWLVLFSIYKWLPHTAVSYRPAAIGAVVAAILVEIGKRTMGAYMEGALSIQQLYGSLGLVPLFMFWVYLMWLVVLFGLEVAATLQMLGGRQLEELEQRKETTGLVDPASILLVMQVVAEHFKQGQPTSARQIAEEIGIAEVTILYMFDRLVEASFLHRLDRDDAVVALAQPPEQLSAEKLIEIGFKMVDEASPGRKSPLLSRLREAQRKLAQHVTLASLSAPSATTAIADQASNE